MTFILGLFKGAWKYLAAAAVVVGAFAFARADARRDGRREAEKEQLEEANEARDKMDAVDRPSSDDVDDSLSDGTF